MIARRGLLAGLGASLLAAPAIIRTPGLLMPVKPVVVPPALCWWAEDHIWVWSTRIDDGGVSRNRTS